MKTKCNFRIKDESKVRKYLATRGCTYMKTNWSIEELKTLLNDNSIEFEGEETGSLRFDTDGRGKYIQFRPSRCYLE